MPEREPGMLEGVPEEAMTIQKPVAAEVLEKKEERALDERWFDRFKEIDNAAPGVIKTFSGDKKEMAAQKAQFLAGEVERPTLKYDLPVEKSLAAEKRFLELKKEIINKENGEKNVDVQNLYRWKINESIARQRMLRAAEKAQAATTPEAKEKEYRRFQRYNDFIHGKPSLEIYSFFVDMMKQKAEAALQSDDEALRTSATDFLQELQTLPSVPHPDYNALVSRETADQVRPLVQQELTDVLHIPLEFDPEGVYGADEILSYCQTALEALQAEGWKLEKVADSDDSLKISQQTQTVRVGENHVIYGKVLQKMLVHEIGTHVQQKLKGQRSRLKLLGPGLDRYIRGEEGITVLKENLVYDDKEPEIEGAYNYLFVSLAAGFSRINERGEKETIVPAKNFRELNTFLEKMYAFVMTQTGEVPRDKVTESAKGKAWERTLRAFRGLDGQTTGHYFSNDMCYADGSIGIWHLLSSSGDKKRTYQLFGVGKHDPSNKRHTEALARLGIYILEESRPIEDDDLEDLERPQE